MVRMVRRRKVARKVLRKRKVYRKKAVGRAMGKRTSDYAKCVEIQETKLMAINDANGDSVGGLINFCLADYQRPQEIAHAYKYYRASKCEVTFIPYFNIAQTNGGGATQLPQLYTCVDRLSNRYIPPTENEMLERGVSPKIFNKKRKLMFKPNLLQEISLETYQPADGQGTPLGIDLAGFQNATALFDKWLPTQQSYGYDRRAGGQTQVNQVLAPNGVNPYALRYHGACFVPAIEGLGVGVPVTVGDIQIKITWEFKGPRSLKTYAPTPEPNPFVGTSSQGAPGATPNTQPTSYP